MAQRKVKLNEFKPVVINDKHCIQVGKDLLKTPKGFVIGAPSGSLCERIIADFEGEGDIIIEDGHVCHPMVFSAYILASTKRDFMDNGGDLSGDLPGWLMNDPMFSPTGGHPIVSMFQVEQYEPAQKFLQEYGLSINVWQRYSTDERDKIIYIFQNVVTKFTPAQKSILINMSWPNGGQFVATIMFLLGRCKPREWASIIFSRSPDVVRIVGDQPMGGFFSISDEMGDEEREDLINSIINDYEINCSIASGFLNAMTLSSLQF